MPGRSEVSRPAVSCTETKAPYPSPALRKNLRRLTIFPALSLTVLTWLSPPSSHAQDLHPVEVARGHSWVSPYWGYSTPKIVCDGEAFYTAGLWGDAPETASGMVYKYDGKRWIEGARLPNIYQPATLLLDSMGRLIIIHNMQEKPVVILRAREKGNANDFDSLPPPPDMANGYYLGAAIRGELVYLAYSTIPSYSMFLAQLDLETLKWTPSALLSKGQTETVPKIAWTYPILVPDGNGLHIAVSNCPDGGDGNTYNKVWYLNIPAGSNAPAISELVAETPIGHNSYAMDTSVDNEGDVHILHMWNSRKYGGPLPEGSPDAGVYHARRDRESGVWSHTYLCPISIAGFWLPTSESGPEKVLQVVTQENGGLVIRDWSRNSRQWLGPRTLLEKSLAPTLPTFMDILTSASGSDLRRGPVIVTDGLRPADGNIPAERVVWSLLPR